MDALSYELTPRDVLFFRDARPMDTQKRQSTNLRMVGHGANWPRPDLLFSAVIHTLLGDPDKPEVQHYGSVTDLAVRGPFPLREGTLYLPRPLDWDMKLIPITKETTDLPAPLTHGFLDNTEGKKSLPAWVSTEGYACYLRGETVAGVETKIPELYHREPRVGTTLDDTKHTSVRDQNALSGQWWMETLRLTPGVSMLCDVMTYKGFLMPITRNGINRIDTSPLQKASYEETQEIFMEAAVFGEKDKLLGVSENVMTGQLLPTGTGVFDVYLDTKKLNEAVDVAVEGDGLSRRFVVGELREKAER